MECEKCGRLAVARDIRNGRIVCEWHMQKEADEYYENLEEENKK